LTQAADPKSHGPEGGLDGPVPAIESWLERWLERRRLPAVLLDSIRYAALGPGKRLRPILTVRSAEAVGGTLDDAVAPAAAIELIHAFSLVHDDLPALDDDDLRRGRPTLHRHAGEAMALLTGDALLGLAMELVIEQLEPRLAGPVGLELIAGCNRMIVGQIYDSVPGSHSGATPLERLRETHCNKTGALIRAACRAGAMCGGADEAQLAALTGFGEAVGLMFQVVDDVLDVTATTEHLGKTAGKDAAQQKLTYPAILGLAASRDEIRRLREVALEALEPLDGRADELRGLCRRLAERTR
jgi:geranylgeranyl pyrophosphate synthase